MGIFITLGWIALLIGIVLVVLGYTVAPQALRPGWGALILGVVLLILGYVLFGVIITDGPDYDHHVGMQCLTPEALRCP